MAVYDLMTGSMPMKETSAKSRPKNSGTSCVETVVSCMQGVTIIPHQSHDHVRADVLSVNAALAKVKR